MSKILLTLLASSASVVVFLAGTNLSFFSSHLTNPVIVNKSVATVKLENLNVASPVLGLTNSAPHIFDANLGCSCSLCLQIS